MDIHTGSGAPSGGEYAQGLANDGVEVGQFHELVVLDVYAIVALRLDDLGAELGLDVGVFGEELEDAREGVGGRVHACKDECSADGKGVSVVGS